MIIRHARKNPLMAANLVIFMAFGLLSWYLIQSGYIKLPASWQKKLNDAVAPGGVLSGSPPTAAAQSCPAPCKAVAPGNVRITLNITGANPATASDTVVFSGRLDYESKLVGSGSMGGGNTIELWDGDKCKKFFDLKTESDGSYYLERKLQGDELKGYCVFAYYPGSGGLGWDAACTDAWRIAAPTSSGSNPPAGGGTPAAAPFNATAPMPSYTTLSVLADEVIAAFNYVVSWAQKAGVSGWPYDDLSLPDHEVSPYDTLKSLEGYSGKVISNPPDYVTQYWHSINIINKDKGSVGPVAAARRVLYL